MFFRLPWTAKRKTLQQRHRQAPVVQFDTVVDEFQSAMADIQDPMRARLYAALMRCMTPRELWFLRGKLFNLICQHHHQGEAQRRVSRLDAKLQYFVDHHPDHTADELPSRPMPLLH